MSSGETSDLGRFVKAAFPPGHLEREFLRSRNPGSSDQEYEFAIFTKDKNVSTDKKTSADIMSLIAGPGQSDDHCILIKIENSEKPDKDCRSDISLDDFVFFWTRLHLDRTLLEPLVVDNGLGLYRAPDDLSLAEISSASSTSSASSAGHATESLTKPSFLVNLRGARIVWSFDRYRKRSVGLYLVSEYDTFKKFCDYTAAHMKFAPESSFTNALFPLFCCLQFYLSVLPGYRASYKASIKEAEKTSGYRSRTARVFRHAEEQVARSATKKTETSSSLAEAETPSSQEELAKASKDMGSAIVGIEDSLLRARLIESILDSLWIDEDDRTREMRSYSHRLRRRAIGHIIPLEFSRIQARTQFKVMQHLLSHNETKAVSALTREMKSDGTSMKVIATMTMFFFPATFTAALFAVPSLKWNETPPWIYWAVALLLTLVVLILWGFWTKHEERSTSLPSGDPSTGAEEQTKEVFQWRRGVRNVLHGSGV